MTEAALGEERLPATPPQGWRAQLELGARLEWRIFKRHPWLVRVVHITRPSPMPNALALTEWVMRALDGSALRAPAKLEVHVVLRSFIQGFAVNLEAEAQSVGDTGITDEEHMRLTEAQFAALAGSGRFPYFAKVIHGMSPSFELDIDSLFELGLARLLDGFTPRIEGRARRRP